MDINPEDIVDQKLMEDDRGRKIQTNLGLLIFSKMRHYQLIFTSLC